MADPLSIVQSILQLVLMVNNMVGTFRHNKEDCHIITELLNRVRAVVEGLSIAEDNSVSDALSDVLNGLEEALKRAMKDIKACQKKNIVLSIIQVDDIANMLRRVQDDLSRNLNVAAFAIAAYNTSMLDGIKENVAALRADIASKRSIPAIVTKEIPAALPDGDLQREMERLVQTIDLGSYQNDRVKREINKTEFARHEVKVGKNKVLGDSNAPCASLSDGKAMSTSVESLIEQDVKETSISVFKLVDKAHSVVVSPAPSQLQQVISVSEVPGEAGSYKVGFLSSETSKLFGAYAAGASFDSNKETIRCPVTLTNKTEHYVGIWVKPTNEQFTRTAMILEPHSSLVVSVTMKAHESPQDTVKIEALMIVLQSKHDLVELESSIGGKLTMDSGFMAHTKKLQADVYWATLPAIICEPARCPQIMSGSTENMTLITSIDVHPIKTWIATTHKGGTVYIWDGGGVGERGGGVGDLGGGGGDRGGGGGGVGVAAAGVGGDPALSPPAAL